MTPDTRPAGVPATRAYAAPTMCRLLLLAKVKRARKSLDLAERML